MLPKRFDKCTEWSKIKNIHVGHKSVQIHRAVGKGKRNEQVGTIPLCILHAKTHYLFLLVVISPWRFGSDRNPRSEIYG